jgi:dihydrofolate reductase
MRKLVVSMNLSLDGYMSGPNAELDWHFDSWNDDMGEKLLEQLEGADTILLGRLTYEAMAGYWSRKPLEQDFPRQDLAIADRMNRHIKIVFSKSRDNKLWKNSSFASGNLDEEIIYLKNLKGKNILLLGSGKLMNSCLQRDLIDEFQLWVHPVILGTGRRLFNNLDQSVNLKLKESVLFDSGVVAIGYEVVHANMEK